jgi:pimeloyl-ACP methyl ester carboxylesterase
MQRLAFEIGEAWDWDAVEKLEDELEPPASERYADLAAQTLVLSGALDIDAIGQAADGLVAGVPDVQGVVWPDVAHVPAMERPDDFAALVLDWVAAHS